MRKNAILFIQWSSVLGEMASNQLEYIDVQAHMKSEGWTVAGKLYETKVVNDTDIMVRRNDGKFGDRALMLRTLEWDAVKHYSWNLPKSDQYIKGNVASTDLPEQYRHKGKWTTIALHRYICIVVKNAVIPERHVVMHCGQETKPGQHDVWDLRKLTVGNLSENARAVPSKGKVPYRNVSYHQQKNQYIVYFSEGKTRKLIGRFTTALDGARCANAHRRDHPEISSSYDAGPEFENNLFEPVELNLFKPKLQSNRDMFEQGVHKSNTKYIVTKKIFDAMKGKFGPQQYLGIYETLEDANAESVRINAVNAEAKKKWMALVSVPGEWLRIDGYVQFPYLCGTGFELLDYEVGLYLITLGIKSIILKTDRGIIVIGGKNVYIHRFVAAYAIGLKENPSELPKCLADGDGISIDHINRNRNDARINNLRFATNSTNGRNVEARRIRYKNKKWSARICVGYKNHEKQFQSREEAEQWVDAIHKAAEVAVTLDEALKNKLKGDDVIKLLHVRKAQASTRVQEIVNN